MTLDRDSQLKSLVDDITTLLSGEFGAADNSLSQGTSDMSSRAREVLGRAQSALSNLVGSEATPGDGSTVVKSVEEEIQKLRAETLSPLKSDLDGLRQQQKSLAAEVAQLEQQRQYYHSLAQQQSNQSQMLDDLVQPLRDRLETAVTEQVGRLLAEFKGEGNDGDRDISSPATPSLNSDQINRVHEQSNEVLEQLQDTLQTVFSALQTNTQRYESTIESSLSRIQTLGEQSEAILEHWLGRLTTTASNRPEDDSIAQSKFAAGVAPLSETDPALAGMPYPDMDLPGASATPLETLEPEGETTRGLGVTDSSSDTDLAEQDNPFALGELDITDLSYRPPAIAPEAASPGGTDEDDIDFVALDGIGAPPSEEEVVLDELDQADGDSAESLLDESGAVEDESPLASDPQGERPLMIPNLESGLPEMDEDEDEDATVIQYVRTDMLSQRREETFQMPDVLVNLSDDDEPKVTEDLLPTAETEDPDWQDDDEATQYLSEDLSSLESAEPEGVADVMVDLAATPMAEAGVIPSDDGNVWDDVAEVSDSTTEAAEAAASFAAIAPDGEEGLLPLMPEAEDPEAAVIEETSGLDADPAVLAQDLDPELMDIDVADLAEGAPEVDEAAGDRDELLMEEMLAVASTEEQVDGVIAADAGEGLEDLLEIGGDEAAASLTVDSDWDGDDLGIDSAELSTNLEDVTADSAPEVEMVADLPAMETLIEEMPATRSLETGEAVGDEESMVSGASDLDELGIGGEAADPFEGLEELEGSEEADATRDLTTEDEGMGGLGAATAAAAAVGFAVLGGGGEPDGLDATLEDLDEEAADISIEPGLEEGDADADLGLELDLDLASDSPETGDDETGDDLGLDLTGELDLEGSAGSEASPEVDLDELDFGETDGESVDLGAELDGDLDLEGLGDEVGDGVGDEVGDDANEGFTLDPVEDGAADGPSLALDEDLALDLGPDLGTETVEASGDMEGLEDLAAELPESLPESADGEVSELLDEAVEAAAAIELPELEDLAGLGDEDSELDDGLDDGGLDLSGLGEDDGLDLAIDDESPGEAEADAGDRPVDLELEAVLGSDGDADAETGIDLEEASGEEGDLGAGDLWGDAADGEAASQEGSDLDLGADLEASSEAAADDDLGLDLDLEGLGGEASADPGLELDLESLAPDTEAGATADDDGLADLGLGTDLEAGADEDAIADLGLEGLGDDGADALKALEMEMPSLEESLDLGGLGDDLSEGLAAAGETESETIASLDEALDFGDVTAVTTDSQETAVAAQPEEEFSLEMLDDLTEFSEESSPMADIDADLDAFLADALGPDADGVEKKKE